MSPLSMKSVVFAVAIASSALLVACMPSQQETPPPPREETSAPPSAADTTRRESVKPAGRQSPAKEALADTGVQTSEARLKPAASPPRSGAQPHPLDHLRAPAAPVDRERYAHQDDNPIRRAAEQPVSTFSIDVDTGSYANVRRMLRSGRLPPGDAVRVEELINYFDYDYPAPAGDGRPFNTTVELAPTPWNEDTHLLQIGIKGYEPPSDAVPPANLVFLIDVSGSMRSANKLALLKSALKLMTQQLGADDRVAIAVYAGASGTVLESTPGDRRATIDAALDGLTAGGRTNGAAGIELAYSLARQGFIDGGINRVVLATDGDFNVGTVDFEQLLDLAERRRETGVSLTTLGFGTGNYNDRLMEQLADAGNGNYHYIDTIGEAQKVLVEELGATLQTIAKDVKIQIEFNPAMVEEYRLIGYENRMLEREDFNNDRVDAGEIGAGHTVTALYELALAGSGGARMDALRYGAAEPSGSDHGDELGFLRLRYKAPGGDASELIERPLRRANIQRDVPSERLRFAAAVAAFGQHLRGGKYLQGYGPDAIHALASEAKGDDAFGYRGELLQLIRVAEGLQVAHAP